MNDENLRPPFGERSPTEAREYGQIGGINSGIVRRQKSAAKDWALFALGMKRKVSDKTKQQLEEMGIDPDDITTHALAMVKIADMAISGNLKAYEILRDTAGEKPTDNSNIAHSFDGDVVVSMKRNDKA